MRLTLAALLGSLLAASYAGDWPQFLGPDRNGVSSEKIAESWEAQAPKRIWKVAVGEGFAGPVVSAGTVFLFHRRGESEILEAFDAQTGLSKWQNKERTDYRDDFGFDPGPRSVPTVAGPSIFAMGAEGLIRCVEIGHGRTVWKVASKVEFNAQKGFFGMACSPLLDGDTLILNIGGSPAAGIAAFAAETGKLRWKSRDDEASYSSPVLAELDGKKRVVAFTRGGVCVLDPADGRQLAEFPWRSRMNASVNAATPLVIGNLIFVTASYGTGAALLEWQKGTLRKVWSNDDSLSSHYATPVHADGYLYGFHGRQEYGASFRCVELRSGTVKWIQEPFGSGTVTLVGQNLLILRESGELTLVKGSPARFAQLGNTQILGSGVRSYPALSEKRLYARDKNSLVCYELP